MTLKLYGRIINTEDVDECSQLGYDEAQNGDCSFQCEQRRHPHVMLLLAMTILRGEWFAKRQWQSMKGLRLCKSSSIVYFQRQWSWSAMTNSSRIGLDHLDRPLSKSWMWKKERILCCQRFMSPFAILPSSRNGQSRVRSIWFARDITDAGCGKHGVSIGWSANCVIAVIVTDESRFKMIRRDESWCVNIFFNLWCLGCTRRNMQYSILSGRVRRKSFKQLLRLTLHLAKACLMLRYSLQLQSGCSLFSYKLSAPRIRLYERMPSPSCSVR